MLDGGLDEVTRYAGARFSSQDSLDFAVGQIIVDAIAAQQDAISWRDIRPGSMNSSCGIFFVDAIPQALCDAVAFIKNLTFCIVELVGLGCLVDA